MLSLANSSSTRISPTRLILDLMDAAPDAMNTSRKLLRAGEVFDFSSNQMRVALSRLVSDGLLENPSRGTYRLSAHAETLSREIQRWRSIESLRGDWQGDWIVLVCANLATEGSSRFREQSRALALRGLQRWKPGLWVRPNNLLGGRAQLQDDLQALGLDAIEGSFLIQNADAAVQKELCQLWDTETLAREYNQRLDTIQAGIQRLGEPLPAALREVTVLGGETLRFLLKDPLLPHELVDSSARRALIQAMSDYDARGRDYWFEFIENTKA